MTVWIGRLVQQVDWIELHGGKGGKRIQLACFSFLFFLSFSFCLFIFVISANYYAFKVGLMFLICPGSS